MDTLDELLKEFPGKFFKYYLYSLLTFYKVRMR